MSDDNDYNPAMSNKDSPHAISGDENVENSEPGENSTEDVPSPLIYGRKMNNPTKVKTSKRRRPWNLQWVIHMWIKIPQVKQKGMHLILLYKFFFEGAPNPKDLEGVDEDWLLAIQKTIQQQLKDRDAERERNITKKTQEYEQKYDFINKALLKSVAQITEMTKPNHPAAASRVKSADKMVMLSPLFDGTKPEVAKQHSKRFNQYIKFQTKSGNIRDPIAEAIELFKHTLDKKALV